jgi:3-hydroxyisobutyrate dehydrogenase
MGLSMARNLLKADFAVTAYNRTQSRAQPLAEAGASIAMTPAEAAQASDVIISMLADDGASREVWLGAKGALAAAAPGAILIECSTVSPAWIEELATHAQKRSLSLLDAPVTGSRMQAEAAQLNFIVGGDAATLEGVRPVLAAMGQSATRVGALGSGARLKLINNYLCGVQVAALAEGLVWIERSGLDREQSLEFLKKGAAGSPLFAGLSARMVEGKYDVNFLLPLMQKDLQYASADAKRSDVNLTMATAADARFEDAVNAGLADKDMSAIIEPVRLSKS